MEVRIDRLAVILTAAADSLELMMQPVAVSNLPLLLLVVGLL